MPAAAASTAAVPSAMRPTAATGGKHRLECKHPQCNDHEGNRRMRPFHDCTSKVDDPYHPGSAYYLPHNRQIQRPDAGLSLSSCSSFSIVDSLLRPYPDRLHERHPLLDLLLDERFVFRGRRSGRVHRKPVESDRKSTRLNSSHSQISYAVFCLK